MNVSRQTQTMLQIAPTAPGYFFFEKHVNESKSWKLREKCWRGKWLAENKLCVIYIYMYIQMMDKDVSP